MKLPNQLGKLFRVVLFGALLLILSVGFGLLRVKDKKVLADVPGGGGGGGGGGGFGGDGGGGGGSGGDGGDS